MMIIPAGETVSHSFPAETVVSSEDNVVPASSRGTSTFTLTDTPFCNSLHGALARGSSADRTMIHAFVSNSGHFPFLHNVLLTMIHNIEVVPWTPLILSLGEGVCPMLANVTELQGHYICVPYLERLLDQLQKYEPESVEEIINATDDEDEEDENESDSDDEDNDDDDAADNDDVEIDYDNEPAAEQNGVENNEGVINSDSLDNNEEDDENDDNNNNGEEYDDGGEITGVDDNDGADKIMEPDDNEPNEDEEPQAAATEDISTLRRSTRSKHDDITTDPELITAPKNDSDHHHDRFDALDKTFFGQGSKKHKFLINSKLYALLDILECGADAFITDTDIGFRKDPRPYFDVAGSRGDIIAQNDTNLENYELDINSGFMYWKRTPDNLDLIKDILTGECIVQYYVYP